jgi:hypothetical protein
VRYVVERDNVPVVRGTGGNAWVDVSSGCEYGDMGVSKDSMDGVDGDVTER